MDVKHQTLSTILATAEDPELGAHYDLRVLDVACGVEVFKLSGGSVSVDISIPDTGRAVLVQTQNKELTLGDIINKACITHGHPDTWPVWGSSDWYTAHKKML